MILFKKFSDITFKDWIIIFKEIFKKIVDRIKYVIYKFFNIVKD